MKFQCQVPFGHIKFLSLMQITSNVVSKYKGIFQCCFLMISMTSYRNTHDISEADWKSPEHEQNYVKYPLIIECNVVIWVIWLGKEWRKLTQKPNENTENPIPSSAYVQKTSYTFLCKRSATWLLSVHGTQWSETLDLTCQFSYKHSLLSHVMKDLVYAHRHTHNYNVTQKLLSIIVACFEITTVQFFNFWEYIPSLSPCWCASLLSSESILKVVQSSWREGGLWWIR